MSWRMPVPRALRLQSQLRSRWPYWYCSALLRAISKRLSCGSLFPQSCWLQRYSAFENFCECKIRNPDCNATMIELPGVSKGIGLEVVQMAKSFSQQIILMPET